MAEPWRRGGARPLFLACFVCALLGWRAHAVFQNIAAGDKHSCAVFSDATVRCWGANGCGQLGYGDMETIGFRNGQMGDSLLPVDLGTDKQAKSIVAGHSHTCVLLDGGDDDGKIKCWGAHDKGQLGLGLNEVNVGDEEGEMGDALLPVDLGTGQTAVSIAAGGHHTCAILNKESLKCWGLNSSGQLGVGDTTDRGLASSDMGDNLPAVDLGVGFIPVAVTAGAEHTCALSSKGGVKCWGANDKGQLGLGDNKSRGTVPADMGDNLPYVDLGTNAIAVAIAAGYKHTCALLDNAWLKCWGDNEFGQLGLGDDDPRGLDSDDMGDNLPPVDLGTGRTAIAVGAGDSFTCAVLENGDVKCWGLNGSGQLGQGNTNPRGANNDMGDCLGPIDFNSLGPVIQLAVGGAHVLALFEADQSLRGWGENGDGQLGLGDDANRGDDNNETGRLPKVDLSASLIITHCALGKHYLNPTEMEPCKPCSEGTWALAGASSLNDCIPCRGGYGPDPGATQCKFCELGSFSTVQGATSGIFAECTKCYPGRYADHMGSVACTLCPAGTHLKDFGADSSDDCEACSAGTFSGPGQGECSACPAGRFAEEDASSHCDSCPPGRYSEEEGATSRTVCEPCGPGKYSSKVAANSSAHCELCPSGRYSGEHGLGSVDGCSLCPTGTFSETPGATTEEDCLACERGTFTDKPGLNVCLACDKGSSSPVGADRCSPCPPGTYSDELLCVSCPSGLASDEGSTSEADCQSLTTSFLTAAVLFVATLVLALIYLWLGRARRVAFLEQQITTPLLVEGCSSASAAILTRMQAERTTQFFWKFLFALVSFVALFVLMTVWFLTNTFLLSTSYFSPPDWLDRFGGEVEQLVEALPFLSFLGVVPFVMRWIRAIDFTFLMAGVRVTCLGAQGPALLFGTAVIVIATVLVIDSQLQAMLALAFVPMASLVQMELISAPSPSWATRVGGVFKFGAVALLSGLMMSFSRYVMQVFTTLVEYSSFIPSRAYSRACNDGGIDSLFATVSTVLFYACALPFFLLLLRLLVPGVPASVRFPLPEKSGPGRRYRKVKAVLDRLNPLKWLLRGLYWMLKKLIAISSARADDHAMNLAPTLRDGVQSAKREEVKRRWEHLKQEELPELLDLLRMLRRQGVAEAARTLWQVACVCAWKVKLALLVVLGVWTDEVATALQVDAIARQYYGWTRDPTLLHEDVMAVIAPMRSMTWMLLPPFIILTKLAEVTNNPPVFVLTDKVRMASPLVFGSWSEAEAVMLEGKALLDAIHERTEKAVLSSSGGKKMTGTPSSAVARLDDRLQHVVCVALVWVLGARLPRYALQAALLVLVVFMALAPRVEILVLAMFVILVWSLMYTFASLLDVRLMLRLRKEQPATAQPQVMEVQMTVM